SSASESCSRASASSHLHASSCCSSSACGSRTWPALALGFVPVERSLRPRVELFAPLRDNVTSSVQSLVPFRSAQSRIEPILTEPHDNSRRAADGRGSGRDLEAKRLGDLEIDDELEFGGLRHRPFPGLAPFRNPA